MLTMPANSDSFGSILGIDPGTTNIGVSIIKVNLDTLEIDSSIAWSINGAKLIDKDLWSTNLFGERYSRINALGNSLLEIFRYYNPVIIASESPFINSRFPASGLALTEMICSIRKAIFEYDIWKDLKLIPPSTVKNGVDAAGGAGKDVMKDKLRALLPILKYRGEIPFELLDEHAIDAMSVAFCMYTKISK